ncbi:MULTISPECIES: hypothetical protein [Thiorhodovibrio]|uniref:hypothetical protein n=1 Tax=Thiorhodovibrio TaxID=61593 RepID=UPI001913C47B|nr:MULTISPECIES: hypothetical protein [Thiorhodovibrio]MBK5970788.1 hypothetical protein [Thiorhodovibrio winogradskyi]WPL10821.1 hypothetical protein Thiosp_00539 [Thiorhodovibrio litoralis]
MFFFFRRYRHAIVAHKAWLLVIVAVSLLVGGWAVIRPDLSFAYQAFSFAGDPPIAASDSPVNVIPLSQLLAEPEGLFNEQFATMQLRKQLSLTGMLPDNVQLNEFALGRVVHDTMTFERTSPGELRIRYQGQSETLGVALVEFFSQRLIRRAQSGSTRAGQTSTPASTPEGSSADGQQPPAQAVLNPEQSIVTGSASSPFHWAKLTPALITFAALMITFLLVVGIKELLNAAFKSERQMARYLGLRVLGTVIDADHLSTNNQSPAK